MLGQMVERLFRRSEGLFVKHTDRFQKRDPFHFDVDDGIERLHRIVEEQGPFDYLINCIGILNSKIDEEDSDSVRRAISVNAFFPHVLSNLAQEIGARVIQISTDGVFAKNAGVCLEDSPLYCEDAYGKTKSLGEVIAPGFLNLRCSIIGPNKLKTQGLLEWLRSQPSGSEVHGYTNHIWNGVTTLQLAKLCRQLILQELFDLVRDESAVHHFCPNKALSKYELLQLFKNAFRSDLTVIPVKSQGGPIHRILDTRYKSLRDLFGYGRSMKVAMDELLAEM